MLPLSKNSVGKRFIKIAVTFFVASLTLKDFAIRPFTQTANAAEPPLASDAADTQAEKMNVDILKKKYWSKGEEGEVRLVQNRLYSKAHKLEFGLFGGSVSTDPFLSVTNTGASLGYHFDEAYSLKLTAWKYFVSPSFALKTFELESGSTTNTNYPINFVGSEFAFSPIYGKLSLLGKAIIHYDLHLVAGLGVARTESGSVTAPLGGIGQKVYLSKNFSIGFDFRTTYYKETILKQHTTKVLGTRSNFSNILTLGGSFLIGFFD